MSKGNVQHSDGRRLLFGGGGGGNARLLILRGISYNSNANGRSLICMSSLILKGDIPVVLAKYLTRCGNHVSNTLPPYYIPRTSLVAWPLHCSNVCGQRVVPNAKLNE